ncbi:MAG TPA: hypothetical protein VHH88_05015 [Verrucomicrobiae bacterium]|nr:hypothetical protein [Verrucomicrobiae bacterium]
MDEFSNKDAGVEVGESALQDQVNSLRQLVVSLLILLLIVSGTFNIYLLRQYRSTSKDLTAYRPFAANVVNSYQKGDGPAAEAFVRNISEYGRTHPDFEKILAKYGIKLGSVPAPVAPTAASAPASAPVKKK